MPPLAIVKDFDAFKNLRPHFRLRRIGNAMHAFVLEAVEPAFRGRVIPAIAFPTHGAGHAMVLELVLKGAACVERERRSPASTSPRVPACREAARPQFAPLQGLP